MDRCEVGEVVEAIVTRLEPYGAWIEFNGQKGLVTIPEISWAPIEHPRVVLSVGQDIRVKILWVPADKPFSASIKAVSPELDPWRDPNRFAVGTEFTSPVVRILDYGVFLELLPSVWGLLRRGQWSGPVHIGDTFHVRVESVNTEKQQIELSIVT